MRRYLRKHQNTKEYVDNWKYSSIYRYMIIFSFIGAAWNISYYLYILEYILIYKYLEIFISIRILMYFILPKDISTYLLIFS